MVADISTEDLNSPYLHSDVWFVSFAMSNEPICVRDAALRLRVVSARIRTLACLFSLAAD